MKTKLQKAKYWASVSVVGIVFGVGLQFVKAWVEPTVAPPGANIAAPLSSSADPQIKAGALRVNGFRNIGTTILDGNTTIGGALTVAGITSNGTLNMNGNSIGNVYSLNMQNGGITMQAGNIDIRNGGGIKVSGAGVTFGDGTVQQTSATTCSCGACWTASGAPVNASATYSGDYTLCTPSGWVNIIQGGPIVPIDNGGNGD